MDGTGITVTKTRNGRFLVVSAFPSCELGGNKTFSQNVNIRPERGQPNLPACLPRDVLNLSDKLQISREIKIDYWYKIDDSTRITFPDKLTKLTMLRENPWSYF